MALSRINSQSIADGTVIASDIADGTVTNAKLAGSITSDKITSVSNTAISGLIQAAQIDSVTNTAISGVIEASQLADTLNLASKTVTLPAGTGGKVLQVVQGTFTTENQTTSTSYQDTNVTLNITTSVTNSKVLYLGALGLNASGDKSIHVQLQRGNTTIWTPGRTSSGGTGATGDIEHLGAVNYLDSPGANAGTTLTYNIQIKGSNGGLVRINDNLESSVILMEIAP